MNWLNLEIKTLRSPSYIGSDPVERATWINLLAFCCEQENGGRIVGAAAWKDRQWQQLCGVTAREVARASRLLTTDGGDVVVWGYDSNKESEVQEMRALGGSRSDKKAAAARVNGASGGRPITQRETQREETQDNPTETHRKEVERKGSTAEAPPSAPAEPRAVPDTEHHKFIEAWKAYYLKRAGAEYPLQPRDFKAVKQLLAHFKTREAVQAFIKAIHSRTGEGYPFTNAETLPEIQNNLARLQAALANHSDGKKPETLFLSK